MSELEKAARQTLEALLKIERTVYHVETPPVESLEEQMRRIASKAITALRQALEQPADPIVGTKTWFDGDKIVTQELKHSEVYKQLADEPVAWMYTSHLAGNERFITRFQHDLSTYKADKVWPLYTRPQPVAPEFYHHVVENEGDWSEWVNPDNDSYMMKCCDCGLVHEMQFKVAKYSEGDECEFVDDPDLQPVFRARRADEAWQEKDTAHRAGGLPQPAAWVGLTIGEIQELIQFKEHSPFALAEDIEAKLKEKNT